ncbi:branched-chain amino acid ABC transporter ATP-binding protein/permease [Microtetraspora fusca]|uniref:branched-chain amino acid ABC transporter ATP-binding protein/permease n=1 Tax=Microtetraspora fusca TaxID=1997 RepID=UPI00082C82B0|nr:ATP-binding cassette domain-containing protein [Microtetraspora fusca]
MIVDLAHHLYLLIAVLGLALPVSYGGQPVLCQGAFLAVGSFGVVHLERAGLPLAAAAFASAVFAAFAGYLVGLLTARLRGAAVALSTWAFAWLVYALLRAFPALSGGSQGLVRPSPARLHSQIFDVTITLTPLVHVAVAGSVCLLSLAAVARLNRGPAGLDWAALREAPALATSLGVPVLHRRAALFATAAAIAAVSGAGITVLLGVAAPSDVSPLLSLQLFVAVLIGGVARLWGPVLGLLVIAVIPPLADALASTVGLPSERSGGVLTALALVAVPFLRGPIERLAGRWPERAERPREPAELSGESARAASREGVMLAAQGLDVAIGETHILTGVDLEVRAGEVHALIGPNGSGKTTALRALAGALQPTGGRILVEGTDVTGAGQLDMVRRGVTRTFQHTVGLERLCPYRQVLLGVRGGTPVPFAAVRHLLGSVSVRDHAAAADREAWRALRLTELAERAFDRPRELGAGEQRLLQVARAVATGARVLLLDEPAVGMTGPERATLSRVLRRLAEGGTAILLVEHDLALVHGVADRITVLERGRVLAGGSPESVAADPAVRRVYLGDVDLSSASG